MLQTVESSVVTIMSSHAVVQLHLVCCKCSVLVWRGASGQRTAEGLCTAVEGLRGGAKRSYTSSVTILKAVQVRMHVIDGIAARCGSGALAWAAHSLDVTPCRGLSGAGPSKDSGRKRPVVADLQRQATPRLHGA
jgi:hypothetical protein